MRHILVLLTLMNFLGLWCLPALSHNPFTTRPEVHHSAPAPPFKSRFFVQLILWQNQLKQRMAELIRDIEKNGRSETLLVIVGLTMAYGAVHAAGPGHGKFVAMSYVLSHRPSVAVGLLFSLSIAMIHGASGIFGVLGLRYLIQRSVSDTMTVVTDVTQVVSFGLITLLGIGILLKNAVALIRRPAAPVEKAPPAGPGGLWAGMLPWAAAVGLVPCPAVVMVMLFCLSMDAAVLGLVLSASISLGMAVTISGVVSMAMIGKTGVYHGLSKQRARAIEGWVAALSGGAIAVFGALFLAAALHPAG